MEEKDINKNEARNKEKQLIRQLKSYPSIAVAFSGGLDSSYLADAAHEALGGKAQMIIADSPSIPRSELKTALELAESRGWNLRIIQTKEHLNPAYMKNTGDRCFHCKTELFSQMKAILDESDDIMLAHGAIEDDKGDIRPGTQAAENYRVVAPLQDVGLYKAEVRILSAQRGLPTAEKASFACLGSRFPTNIPINLEAMTQVEQAEEILKQRGYNQYRVRHHGDLCRVELEPSDFERLLQEREVVTANLKALGYRFITLDLCGYRTGSSA